MDNQTVAYSVRLANISYWYEVEVRGRKKPAYFNFEDAVARSLRERKYTLDARTLVNRVGQNHMNAVVSSKKDLRFGAHTVVTWINRKSQCSTSYLHIDALAWHVYIEDCRLKARPVWYKPPGRELGISLGDDPVAEVLDYYERHGKKVLAAIDGQSLWRERCLKAAKGWS